MTYLSRVHKTGKDGRKKAFRLGHLTARRGGVWTWPPPPDITYAGLAIDGN